MTPQPLTEEEMKEQCRKASDFAIQLISETIPDWKKAEQFRNDLKAIRIFNESLPAPEQDKIGDEQMWLRANPLN